MRGVTDKAGVVGDFSSHSSASEGRGFVGLDSALGGDGGDGVNDPFFELLEQLGCLVKSEAFPALKYMHDLRPQSRVMQKTGRVKVWDVEMRSVGSFAGRWWDDGPCSQKHDYMSLLSVHDGYPL
ncbi:hypothetical protein BKA70DRAFT_681634 [Coprinopsis sp. MPI-PUGE-AT-0042]|nr:hypothetical protein BKA70DRAFT_681634 [Coprinopsis sp. MPI-PUGE-AT-0042]